MKLPRSSFAVDPRTAATPAGAVALRASSCTLPAHGWDSWPSRHPFPGRCVPGPATAPPREPRSLKHRPEGASRTIPIPPASSAGTCGLRGRRRWAAVPGCPRRAAQRKPLWPDLAPGPRRGHPGPGRHLAGAPPLRSSPCRAVAVAGLRRSARRSRCPRRAQQACPAHHLRPPHTRPRPDCQPAHRSSPPLQPLVPGWPTKSTWTPGISSVMRPCRSWTQQDTTGPGTPDQIR
jgi:hypothetical protein